jgi:predicted TIM-barrel fold metal-dependent hydrolase
MLDAVRRHRERLKAVVMLDPATTTGQLFEMEAKGAVGVRYNLIGLALPDFARQPHAGFVQRLAERGWHVEIHREARDLPALLPPLLGAGVKVAIDHFGRPDPALGAADPGFRYLLTLERASVWVKVSAAYRCGGNDAARELSARLLQRLGPERLVWGSDWPHTQHEATTYASTFGLLEASIPDPGARGTILGKSPARLMQTGS